MNRSREISQPESPEENRRLDREADGISQPRGDSTRGRIEGSPTDRAKAAETSAFIQDRLKERKGFTPGSEIPKEFAGLDPHEGYAMARRAAMIYSGLLDERGASPTVPFVSDRGPYSGRVMGRQSPDGLQGWRIDADKQTGAFHVNWWDRRGDPQGRDRSRQYYGRIDVSGGTRDFFWEVESHFPGNVKREP